MAEVVDPVIIRPLVLADPSDDAVLYTAADGRADYLCTRNTAHFSGDTIEGFCAAHGILVRTDLEILREVFDTGHGVQ
jgi:hypothetical protein